MINVSLSDGKKLKKQLWKSQRLDARRRHQRTPRVGVHDFASRHVLWEAEDPLEEEFAERGDRRAEQRVVKQRALERLKAHKDAQRKEAPRVAPGSRDCKQT